MNRRHVLVALIVLAHFTVVASQTVTSDLDWKTQSANLKGTPEAAFIIRIGDVDNLGFGWPEKFDPFCGRMTQTHPYPWKANDTDAAGFDRMLVSSKFDPRAAATGPAAATAMPRARIPRRHGRCRTLSRSIRSRAPRSRNAYLQMFIDDFQAPIFCSRFQLTLNGTRFVEGEKVLNAIEQTGPVGKLVTLRLPEDFYPALSGRRGARSEGRRRQRCGGRLRDRLHQVAGQSESRRGVQRRSGRPRDRQGNRRADQRRACVRVGRHGRDDRRRRLFPAEGSGVGI